MDPDVYLGDAVDPHATMVLYGPRLTPTRVRALYSVAIQLFQRLGLDANVGGPNLRNKYGKYHSLTARRERLLEHADVAGFSVAFVPPPDTDAAVLGWLLAGAGPLGPKLNYFQLHGKMRIVNLSTLATVIMPAIASVYPATYGYGYILDAPYGPGAHVVGIGFESPATRRVAPLPECDKKKRALWFNRSDEAIAQGALRDVYPVNYLTNVHSTKEVDGQRVFNWITADQSRGQLRQIRADAWLWCVPENRCVELGEKFRSAGLLI